MHTCKKASLLAAALLLAAPSVSAVAAEQVAAPAAAQEQNFPAIRVVETAERELVDRIMVTGTFQAVEEVYVQPQVEALRIEKLNVDVGDMVKAGDTLATLSEDALILQKSQLQANRAKAEAVGAQLVAQLVEAKANEAEAIRQAVRAEKLEKIDAVSTSQAEQLRASATAASARVNSANQAILANKADVKVVDAQIADIDLKLARTAVTAPVGGIVSARHARIGAIAASIGNPLFTIIRDNAIELKGDVAEGDLLKLKPGQPVHMAVAGTSAKVTGTVRSIDPVIDSTTRLGSVKVAVNDPAQARIGMYASAEVIVSDRKVLSVPLTAITAEKNGSYVRKIVDQRVKLTKVVTGVQDGDFVEIVSGLGAKDVVVEKAGAYVRDGDRITPVFLDKTASN
ncbi:efflux RND transporter periplasmic adaptor subunit [Rhizobium sp. KVB221]|uniref:Efflux RND transporter periplasmic adaptor subunit n=1 Tax=Rhizobium setariae TaxID=2801340 RepID=A0A936YL94_9HYPH|nr:efflux RND transporter periplasmic adaptor subunit [Rhizobium setariae]MBL0371628.1 efflux RND transporter periplasmic adaptor subunit [Rhizobium setariae]